MLPPAPAQILSPPSRSLPRRAIPTSRDSSLRALFCGRRPRPGFILAAARTDATLPRPAPKSGFGENARAMLPPPAMPIPSPLPHLHPNVDATRRSSGSWVAPPSDGTTHRCGKANGSSAVPELAFPDCQNGVAHRSQSTCRSCVPAHVPFDLAPPEHGSALRPRSALATNLVPVPEAPVNEDGLGYALDATIKIRINLVGP